MAEGAFKGAFHCLQYIKEAQSPRGARPRGALRAPSAVRAARVWWALIWHYIRGACLQLT